MSVFRLSRFSILMKLKKTRRTKQSTITHTSKKEEEKTLDMGLSDSPKMQKQRLFYFDN